MFNNCSNKQESIFKALAAKNYSAVTPVEQTNEEPAQWWMTRHIAINKRLQEGHVDLLFIGNSIIHGWENTGKKYWDNYYEKRNAVNMGFGWDRTQHVLWRLNHSNFDHISPKLAVVLIGINNYDNSPEEIADGIIAICKRLREKLPEMKILLLAIFPCDHKPSDHRKKMEKASRLASEIADNKMIYYLDINQALLTDEGTLSEEISSDYLHPSEKGYKIWAETMEPVIAKLMGEID